MISGLGIIPHDTTIVGNYTEGMSGEDVFDETTGVNFENITSLSLDNLDIIAIAAGGIVLSALFKSGAPFAVGLFLGLFVNTFRRSIGIFYSFEINSYMVVAAVAGIIFLIVITLIEYFTQGDA
jgi:hypothetical protein